MGKVLSVISRKARRFNAENRAHRYLDKEKLAAAPKYQSNISDYERVQEEIPNFAQHESKKHVELDDRLKQVYVTSTDHTLPHAANVNSDTKKQLPLNRKQVEDFEFGYLEPEKVTSGRCTLRQALHFITSHQAQPEIWTIEKIAEEYKLKPNVVDNILKHFRAFDVYKPDKKSDDKILMIDRVKKLWNESEPKPLPPPKFEADKEFDRMLQDHYKNEEKKKEAKEKNSSKP